MKIVSPELKVVAMPDIDECVRILDKACGTCYQRNVEKPLVRLKNIVKAGHHSVIEHVSCTFSLLTDRAVTHELVRHRIGCSYSQESQRYCAYEDHVKFCKPHWIKIPDGTYDCYSFFYELRGLPGVTPEQMIWLESIARAEWEYKFLLQRDVKPQDARGILPNATATNIVFTMNLRALAHFVELRASREAHPDIRLIAEKIKDILKNQYNFLTF